MFALAVTDLRWHRRMLDEPVEGLVNFWTPTPWGVRLQPGSRFFFMLKAPVRRIGGFGTLNRYEEATIEEAWDRFGPANGVGSLQELDERVRSFAKARSKFAVDANPTIGCVLLEDCVFLSDDLQVPPEAVGVSFPSQVVKFKGFDGELVLPFEGETAPTGEAFKLVTSAEPNWSLRMSKKRAGQPQFRRQVLDAYGRACAFTGTRCAEALDAAHIQPFLSLASNHVQNGLALRKDVHALFDAGLLTVSEVGRVRVSPLLASTEYHAMDGAVVRAPTQKEHAPSPLALHHHRTGIYRAGGA